MAGQVAEPLYEHLFLCTLLLSALFLRKQLAMQLPKLEDFPLGTEFYIKEFDVPLVRISEGSKCKWLNWFGGTPKEYDATALIVSNNWEAESFEQWLKIVKDSL
ncbi:hypothetical protein B3C1_13973 [Gallaecimonas xiamenensis 3-C-1]|uniref:Uncharacterized protein n=1 Tax=Gallaecimonas xiamenensis 3-C-1 TaxID=745411 RepID=K2JYC7_9GAMM|nr:hypothetical protein B3C1_13973 [Gallaecimonas xiamenensis 3-C-1]